MFVILRCKLPYVFCFSFCLKLAKKATGNAQDLNMSNVSFLNLEGETTEWHSLPLYYYLVTLMLTKWKAVSRYYYI